MKKYSDIPVPALFVFAIPERPGIWVENSLDPKLRELVRTYVDAVSALKERQAKAIEDAVSTARVVRLPANHYVYLSNQADVLREMRSFLSRLR